MPVEIQKAAADYLVILPAFREEYILAAGPFYYESGKFKAVFFALSNSYYLSYDEMPGRPHEIAEKSVTFGIDCGT